MKLLSVEAIVDTIEELNSTNFSGEKGEYKKEEIIHKLVVLERIFDKILSNNENVNLKIYLEDFYDSFIKSIKDVAYRLKLNERKNKDQLEIFISNCNSVINLLRDYNMYGCDIKLIDKDMFPADDSTDTDSECDDLSMFVHSDNSTIAIILNKIAKCIDDEDKGDIDQKEYNEKVKLYMDILMEFIYTTEYDALNHRYVGPNYTEKAKYVYNMAYKNFINYIQFKQTRSIDKLGIIISKFNKILAQLYNNNAAMITKEVLY